MMASTEPDVDLQKVCAAAEMPCKESSPNSKCPICLDRFRNMSYADKCFHRFCFRCILEWGKNKAECPLCKQPFSAVYHSVRSEDDFKLYELRPAENGSFGSVQGQRFRYRTTLTHERRREGCTQRSSRQHEVMRFRRWLYRRGVRVRGVRDGGRSRDTSAEFFRKNPACLHRLVPWLKRELAVLYGSHDSVADVVLHVILSLITRHDMQAEAFLRELRPFLSSRTEHFLHEFLSFAKSPFNMEAYDRHAVYDCPAPSHLSAVSEDVADLSSAPSPWDDETPGPSYSTAMHSVFTVTISDSDVDSASEEETVSVNANATAIINVSNARVDEDNQSSDGDCVIIGFIKPTVQRTPELVLLSSDSEASVQEEPKPSTSSQSDARHLTNQRSWNTDDVPSHSATKHNSKRRERDRRRERDWERDRKRERDWERDRKRERDWEMDRKRERERDRDYSSYSHRRRSRSLSCKDRRKSKATSYTSLSCTHAHTHYRRHAPQQSRARSRSKTHSFSRSRTRAHSRSRTCARSGSRTCVHSYSGSRRMQASLQNRKCSECLSVSPSPSSHRKPSHDKPCGKRKHKSLHGERRSKEKHHHPKKNKKTRRRQSSSMEVSDECRHRKKKKKHKRDRNNRSERMGRSSGVSSPTVITIHTDTESVDEATPPRDIATTNTEPLNSSRGAPTPCANSTSHNNTASNPASDKTLFNDLPTGSTSSHTPSNITPPNKSPQTSRASNTDSPRHVPALPQCSEAAVLAS